MTQATTQPRRRGAAKPPRAWLRIFWIGLGLWAASVLVTVITANANLVPTIVLLGSFLVPVTFVAWAYEHGRAGEITVPLLFTAFVVGGVLGVLGASLLETYLLSPSLWMYAGVGLIEEAVKLAALLFVARRLRRRSLRDGLVLGATVGFGFAAFESAGYALNALFTIDGLSLRAMVETEILRGMLTPLGHGLWTAILGGVLFGASRNGRWRLGGPVLAAYLGVSALHALWDSMHGIAIALTLRFTGASWQWSLLQHGYLPQATTGQNHLIAVLNWAGIVIISLIALVWLRSLAQSSLGRGSVGQRPPGIAPPWGAPEIGEACDRERGLCADRRCADRPDRAAAAGGLDRAGRHRPGEVPRRGGPFVVGVQDDRGAQRRGASRCPDRTPGPAPAVSDRVVHQRR